MFRAKYGYSLLLILLLAASTWLLVRGEGEDVRRSGWQDPRLGGEAGLDRARESRSPSASERPIPRPGGPDSETGEVRPAATLALDGRVVDERRLPVPGAHVELRAAARVVARGETDDAGEYRLEPPLHLQTGSERLALFARTNDGRGAVVPVSIRSDAGPAQTLPVLVVEPVFDLDVRVVREGSAVPRPRVAAVRRDLMLPILLATGQGDPQGRVRLSGLPAGPIDLFATAPGHGRGTLSLGLPPPEDALPATIALSKERILRVQVIDGASLRPVSGAELVVGDARTMPPWHGPGYLPALPPLRTNLQGLAVVRGLGATERVHVNVRAAGYAYAPWWLSKVQVAPPGQDEMRVALTRTRRVRFLVDSGQGGAPVEGAALAVRIRGGEGAGGGDGVTARMERENVVVWGLGPGPVTGTLVAPTGARATFFVAPGATQGAPLTFRAAHTVRVRVVEPGGVPVEGLPLELDAGDSLPIAANAVTDSEGIAVFEGVGGDRASVRFRTSEGPLHGPVLATFDLGTGGEPHEVVVQPGVGLVLALRIDGEARLPAAYTLVVGGERCDPARITEDAAAGLLRCEVRPPTPDGGLVVELHSPGLLPETFEADPRGTDVEKTLYLRSASRLVAWVTPPRDEDVSLLLQCREKERKEWVPARIAGSGEGGRGRRGPDGTHTFEGLEPGRYRVFDQLSREASDAVDVTLGADVELRLDLSLDQWIAGHVVGPPGANLAQARVLVEGRHDASTVWSGVHADATGAFRLRVHQDAPLTLHVVHPALAPAVQGGRITIRPGDDDVVLRLEAGAELHFRVAGHESATTPPSGRWQAPVTVHLFSGGVDGARTCSVRPVAKEGCSAPGACAPARTRSSSCSTRSTRPT